MTIQNLGYRTSRWNDFGGGINVRTSSDSIDDKQWVVGNNMSSEGNKLITIPGFVQYVTPGTGVAKGQGIALYSGKILILQNTNLYIYDTATGTTFTKTGAVANATDTYTILTNKAFSGNIAIVCINMNQATTENVTAYEFDGTTFTTKTFTSITNANFKCGAFHEGRLLLGGNPTFPSSLYYSKTGSATSPNLIYDFSGYDSNSQNIGDGEPIVNITTNHNELFVFKTNSVWRQNGYKDTRPEFAYIFKQEAATGALNAKCVVPVEQDVIYFDGVNIRRMSYEANINALNDDAISKDIAPIFASLPSAQSLNATMYYVYPYVKLFLKDKFSSNNSLAIVYNIVDKSYSTQTGIEVVQGVGGFVNNKRTAYFVTPQTSTIYQDNVGYTFNGGNIQMNHKSKRYVLGDGVDYKRIAQVELYGMITPGLKATIDIYVNGVVIDSRDIYYADYILPTTGTATFGDSLLGSNNEELVSPLRDFVVRYEYFNDGRDFSFGVRSNGQGRVEIHGLNLVWKSVRAYDLHY